MLKIVVKTYPHYYKMAMTLYIPKPKLLSSFVMYGEIWVLNLGNELFSFFYLNSFLNFSGQISNLFDKYLLKVILKVLIYSQTIDGDSAKVGHTLLNVTVI